MAYQERFDMCVVTGTYMKDGEERKRWSKIGVAFKDEDGSMYGTIDMIPLTEGGKIKFALFKPKEEQAQARPVQQQTYRQEDEPPF
jgi:hypothetical protein